MSNPKESRPAGERDGDQGNHTQSNRSTNPSIPPMAAESFRLAYWLKTYKADPSKPVPYVDNPDDHITTADLHATRDEFQDWCAVAPRYAFKLYNLYIKWRDGDAS